MLAGLRVLEELREVDNIVWGTSSESDNVTWGNSGESTPLFDDPEVPTEFDYVDFEVLLGLVPPVVPLSDPLLLLAQPPSAALPPTGSTGLGGGF